MEEIKIEEIININQEEKKIEFKENIVSKIQNLLLTLRNSEINDEIKKQLLDKLKDIFINFREIAIIFVISPSCRINENINLIKILIDFYLFDENLKEISKELLIFFIQNTTLEKEYFDYIYEKIGKEHREDTLTENKLLSYIDILSLLYGKNIEPKKFCPKRYFNFYDPLKSEIITNFNQENKFYLNNNNFYIYFCFFIDEYCQNKNTDIADITFDIFNHLFIKLDDNVISVFYNDKNLEKLKINIELNEWIYLKLYFQENTNENNFNIILEKINEKNEKKIESYNIKNLISSFTFFRNFKGKLFFIFSSNEEIEKNRLDQLLKYFHTVIPSPKPHDDNNQINIHEFNNNIFNFIFSSYLFNESFFELIEPITNNNAYLFKPEDNFFKNCLCSYNNYTKNIFMIGGINPLIPLFEFLYSFNKKINNQTKENKEDNQSENEEKKNFQQKELQIQILNKLIELIKLIKRTNKNSSHLNETKFYKNISLFIENLDSEIIEKSCFFDFIIELSNEKITGTKNSFFSSLFFNFQIIGKFSLKQKDIYFNKILELINKYDNEKSQNKNTFILLLNKNCILSEFFLNINEYKEISETIFNFLEKIYLKLYIYDDCLPILFKLLTGNKINPKIIELIFFIIKTKKENDRIFEKILENQFDDIIISLLIKEKRFEIQFKMFLLIQQLTQNFPEKIEKNKSEKLTKFLKSQYLINELPKDIIEEGKKLIEKKPEPQYNKYFYEWLNICFRLIFIGLVEINDIKNICLIPPFKKYDDDFIFGVFKLIYDIKFPSDYAKYFFNKKNIDLCFCNELNKIIFVLKFILLNYNIQKIINTKIEEHLKCFSDFIDINYLEVIKKKPIEYITNLLFDLHYFELNQEQNAINNYFSIEYILFFKQKIQNEYNIEIIKEFIKKEKIENIYKNCIEIYRKFIEGDKKNNIFNLKDLISNRNGNQINNFIKMNIFNEDEKKNLLIVEELKKKKIPIQIYDLKIMKFFKNYFLNYFNKIKIEDYIIIIVVICFVFSSFGIYEKNFMSKAFHIFSEEEMNSYIQNLFDLLKIIYFRIIKIKDDNFKFIFKVFLFFIKKIIEINTKYKQFENYFLKTPFYKFQEIIKNQIGISIFKDNESLDIENLIKQLMKVNYKSYKMEIPNIQKEECNIIINYENQLIKNKKFEIQIKNQIKSFSKYKLYKKIKNELFTWNGSYSDKNLFYKSSNKDLILNYKKSNHLTKEKISPLIVPMIYEFDYKTYFDQKFFNEDIKKFYIIPLPEINFETISETNKQDSYFQCCLLTISNHFKGIIFLENEYLQFIEIPNNNQKCLGSLLKKNNKPKYLKLNINEITNYFERKYYDESNSIEIFTERNKSYYFIFNGIKNKETFLDVFKSKIIKEFPNLNYYQSKWIKNEISNLEYLMWINIYGNRSLRDIYQYPIFPWTITNYKISYKKVIKEKITTSIFEKIKDDLIETSKRDFKLPLGLMELSPKGTKRKNSYVYQFISSIISILEEHKFDDTLLKKYEEINKTFTSIMGAFNILKNNDNNISNYKGYTSENFEDIISSIKLYNNKNKNSINYDELKINYDISEKLKTLNVDIISYPSYYGSHFSNAAYTSHFLNRIFPFTLTAIGIQGNAFDSPDRLFINLEKTFDSVTGEKSDLRELIPEFFYLPEMFLNINNLNLGKLQDIKENNDNLRNSTVNLIRKLNENDDITVKDVFLPFWCKNDPYLFISIYRSILEDKNLNINDWIDLIFGFKSCGIQAQNSLNLYSRYCYPDCISSIVKNKQFFYPKNDDEILGIKKLAELGVNPIQLFKDVSVKKNTQDILSDIEIVKINYLKTINTVYQNDYSELDNYQQNLYYIQQMENLISIKKILNINNEYYLFTGNIIGESNIYNPKEINYQILNSSKIKLFSLKDNNRITACAFYEKEDKKIIIYTGTEKGSIAIYEEKEVNRGKFNYINIIHPHTKQINYLNVNLTLNMLIDCSNDNLINLYIIPSLKIVRSIYNDTSLIIEKVFLSSSPLPSFITYSRDNHLVSYSINGKKLTSVYINNEFNEPSVISGNFVDYLIYRKGKNFLSFNIKKLPYLTDV